MTTTVCAPQELSGERLQVLDRMFGSRRGNPSAGPLHAATLQQPNSTWKPPMAETAFIVGQNGEEQAVQVAQSWGLTTRVFSSGLDVLEADIAHSSGCLITELLLPDMRGSELLEELNRRESILPVVVLTKHADVPSAVRVMQLGATAVLENPCPEHELSTAIRNATQRHRQHRDAKLKAIEMRKRLATLNSNETLLANMIVDGEPNKVIARRMDISLRTVENRRSTVYSKMGVTSVAKLVECIVHARLVR